MSKDRRFHPTCPECGLLQASAAARVCEECGARLYMSEAELAPRKRPAKQAAERQSREKSLGVRWYS